jgi:hypothetical protein
MLSGKRLNKLMPFINSEFILNKFGDRCFQLSSPIVVYKSRIITGFPAHIEYSSYDGAGTFYFYQGLCYDGASNPIQVTAQTNSELALGLPHDVKFRFMALGLIPFDKNFQIANEELEEDALIAGMPHLIANAFHEAVDLFGTQFTRVKSYLIEINTKSL